MLKLAKQNAREKYPIIGADAEVDINTTLMDLQIKKREAYVQGYEKCAMDAMEKALKAHCLAECPIIDRIAECTERGTCASYRAFKEKLEGLIWIR